MNINKTTTKPRDNNNYSDIEYALFNTVEDVWFWFIAAQQAKDDGARYMSGAGTVNRACEPVDILKILDRLRRSQKITLSHLLVLRHYGKRFMAPDRRRVREERAYYLWNEAMELMRTELEKKGILEKKNWAERLLASSEKYTNSHQLPLFESTVS